MQFLFQFFMWISSLFLILLVLIQRGRGGGLAGALGGMGGQSAFGTKAGDLFTRITIGVAAFWILLYVVALKVLHTEQAKLAPGMGRASQQAPDTAPAAGADDQDAAVKDESRKSGTGQGTTDETNSNSAGSAADAATSGNTSNPPAESGDGQ